MVPDSEIALKFIFRQADPLPDVRERTPFHEKDDSLPGKQQRLLVKRKMIKQWQHDLRAYESFH